MNKYTFSTPSVNERMKGVFEAINKLSSLKPITGFNYKYYVPGWIGAIQHLKLDSKINKFASKPFCDGKSYFQWVDWIVNEAGNVGELQVQAKKTIDSKDLSGSQYEQECKIIIDSFNALALSWANCVPEAARWPNRMMENDKMISSIAILLLAFEELLGPIGYPKHEELNSDFLPFKQEAKGQLYQWAGIFLNMLIIIVVGSIIATIHDIIIG